MIFKESDDQVLSVALLDMVSPSVRMKYKDRGLAVWYQFLGDRGWDHRDGQMNLFMQGSNILQEHRTRLLVLYAMWLKEEGLDPKLHFQALQYDFQLHLKDISCFNAREILAARKTIYSWNARENSKKKDANEKQAVTWEMLQEMREFAWKENIFRCNAQEADLAMSFLAGLMMWNWGLRISELAKTESDPAQLARGEEWANSIDHHALKAEDVKIGVYQEDGSTIRWYESNHWCQSAFHKEDVELIGLSIRSSKTNQTGGRSVKHLIDRGSEGESLLIDLMCDWSKFAQYSDGGDMFLSRYQVDKSGAWKRDVSRKRLISKMVSDLVKNCATRMGLDPVAFTTKSFKIGGISSLKSMGESKDEIMRKMDHASETSSKTYQRPMLSEKQGPIGAVSLDSENTDTAGYQIRNVKIMTTAFKPIGNSTSSAIGK